MATIKHCEESILKRLAVWRNAISALDFISHVLNTHGNRSPHPEAVSQLYQTLYREMNDVYRNLFMWGVVDPTFRLQAAEIALTAFLEARGPINPEVMRHTTADGKMPPGWHVSEEEQLREEIALARQMLDRQKKRKPKGVK